MAVIKKKIIIVGCGPGAADYVTPAAAAAARKADVFIVSRRLKDYFPDVAAERIDSGAGIDATLDAMAARRDAGLQVVLLATGDPGIASLARPVIRRFGREHCEVIPGISSIQVAFARIGLDWEDTRIVSAHSRDPEVSATELGGYDKLAILGGRDGSLYWAERLIAELGEDRRVFLCEELTLPEEKITEIEGGALTDRPVSSRAIILIIKGEAFS
jgi:cobalt-precorrin-7 (C5)-methyltransferase